MLQLLDAFRPTALPALLFLLGLPLFLLLKPGAARAFFSVAGAVALSVAGGVELAGGLIAAIVAGYLVVEGLARVRGANRAVYAIAWILLHVAYLACFQLPLPGAFQPPHLRAADGPGTFLFFSGIAVTFFRLLSYAHARLRGGAARLELADYLAYMLFFPQFRHGPLERGPDFAPRLRSARERWTRRDVGASLLRV